MGLILDISLDKDIREIDRFFDDLRFRAVTIAARQGLNKAATSIRAKANKEIRKKRHLGLREVKKRIDVKKARGMDITKLEAQVVFTGVPLPLILFLVGVKRPKKQRLANPKRKSRQVQIKKGNKQRKPGIFVQKASRGRLQYQVFRRKDPSDKTKGFVKQSVPSIAEFLRKNTNVLNSIENTAIAVVAKEYDRALAFQLSKIKL